MTTAQNTLPDAAPDTMQAWQVVRYGSPVEALELTRLPMPVPGPGEFLARTSKTVLNYNEVDGCRGRYLTINPPLPYTLGMELVGAVEAAGPGLEAWLGHRVMATAVGGFGGHAEYVLAKPTRPSTCPRSSTTARPPRSSSPSISPISACTNEDSSSRTRRCSSTPAPAGWARPPSSWRQAAGATVIATAGSAGQARIVPCLGADVAIDYRDGTSWTRSSRPPMARESTWSSTGSAAR